MHCLGVEARRRVLHLVLLLAIREGRGSGRSLAQMLGACNNSGWDVEIPRKGSGSYGSRRQKSKKWIYALHYGWFG